MGKETTPTPNGRNQIHTHPPPPRGIYLRFGECFCCNILLQNLLGFLLQVLTLNITSRWAIEGSIATRWRQGSEDHRECLRRWSTWPRQIQVSSLERTATTGNDSSSWNKDDQKWNVGNKNPREDLDHQATVSITLSIKQNHTSVFLII